MFHNRTFKVLSNLILLALTFSALGVTRASATGTWENIGSAGFSTGGANYTSLAFDDSGTPYVAYQDFGNDYKATVMKFDGTNWVIVGSAGFSAEGAYRTTLAFDGGTPYVAYLDWGNDQKVTVMKFDGTNWITVGSAGFSIGSANYTSLAIDGNGTPYVAYQDWGNGSKATVMKFDGTDWVTVGSAGFSAGGTEFTSLAFDGNGTPYVSYQDWDNSGKTTVMKFDGTDWVTVGSAGFSAGSTINTSLAFDSSNTPYVAYDDSYNNITKASVMKFDGTNWVTVGSAHFSAGDARYTSLAIDGGTPYVAYSDGGNGGKATVMKFNGANWVTVGSAGFSAGGAFFTSLAFYDGTPYVAYVDAENGYNATVMHAIDTRTDPILSITNSPVAYNGSPQSATVISDASGTVGNIKYNGSATVPINGGNYIVTADFIPDEPAAYNSLSDAFVGIFVINDWTTIGSAGFSVDTAYYTSLAIDGDGIPYVAYLDAGNESKATVMKFDGTSWVAVGSAGFSAGQADNTSLAFNDGTPYVAYQDLGNSGKATVMKFDGTSWVNVGPAGFSVGQADNTSLAFSSGTPYVAYQDLGNESKATVMKFDGTNWVTVGSAGFSVGQAVYTSLAFHGGTPYVAYQDWGNEYKATVMKFDGTNWVTVGSAGFSAGSANYTSLAIDDGGTPYVAYQNSVNSKATVMKFDGTNWVTVGSAGFSAGSADWPSLAIDGEGMPYMAYCDWGNSGKATVMKFDGANWVAAGLSGFSADTAHYISLAIDGSGTPYVAYLDGANSKATVMKLILSADTTAPTVSSIIRANANHTNAASINFTVTFSESVTDVDMTGPVFNDFALTTSPGISGASITGVSGSGTTYMVTVNTGSGIGTVRLDVPDGATINDLSGNPLANIPFISGESYTVRSVDVYIGGALQGSYFLASGQSTRVNYPGLDSGPVKVVNTDGVPIIAAIRDAWAVNGVTTSFSQLMGLPLEQLSNKYVFPGYNNVTLNEQLRIANVDTVQTTVTVMIGGVLRGTYTLYPPGSPLGASAVRVNYPGLDSGPVVIEGTAGVKIISAIREAWAVNGVTTSFVQFMGLPAGQLSNKYVFPAYNNVTLNEQLRIANVDTVQSTVTVTIGGVLRGTYTLYPPGSPLGPSAVRINYPSLDSGPVIVEGTSNVKIISSIRDAWAVNGVTTSFSQLMGMPAEQLSNKYLFPAYNNVTLNEQLRISNVDTVESTVTVTIGGVLRGTYTLYPPGSPLGPSAVRINYPSLDSGPVVVQGTPNVEIISAIREAWAANGVTKSFVQLMGLPAGQLSSTYLFPAYNNVTLNEQLRFGVP